MPSYIDNFLEKQEALQREMDTMQGRQKTLEGDNERIGNELKSKTEPEIQKDPAGYEKLAQDYKSNAEEIDGIKQKLPEKQNEMQNLTASEEDKENFRKDGVSVGAAIKAENEHHQGEAPTSTPAQSSNNKKGQPELTENIAPSKDFKEYNQQAPPSGEQNNTNAVDKALSYGDKSQTKESGQNLTKSGVQTELPQPQQQSQSGSEEKSTEPNQPKLDSATADRIQSVNDQNKNPNAVDRTLSNEHKSQANEAGQNLQKSGVKSMDR